MTAGPVVANLFVTQSDSMLKKVDSALATVVECIADDVLYTAKSLRDQGVLHTVGEAVEDAVDLVREGVNVVQGTNESQLPASQRPPPELGAFQQYSLSSGVVGGGQPIPDFEDSAVSNGRRNNSNSSRKGNGGEDERATYTVGGDVGAEMLVSTNDPEDQEVYQAARLMSKFTAVITKSRDGSSEKWEGIVEKDCANELCFDCGADEATWVSVNFGIFLCVHCGGSHRTLGTHISRIRSTKMDVWKDTEFRPFELGGNSRLQRFFIANGVDCGIGETGGYAALEKYKSPQGAWYIEALSAKIKGENVPAAPQGVTNFVGIPSESAVFASLHSETKPDLLSDEVTDVGNSTSSSTPPPPPPPARDQVQSHAASGNASNSATNSVTNADLLEGMTNATPNYDLLGMSSAPPETSTDLHQSTDLLNAFGTAPVLKPHEEALRKILEPSPPPARPPSPRKENVSPKQEDVSREAVSAVPKENVAPDIRTDTCANSSNNNNSSGSNGGLNGKNENTNEHTECSGNMEGAITSGGTEIELGAMESKPEVVVNDHHPPLEIV